MGPIKAYTLTDPELEELADKFKTAIVGALVKDGLLERTAANKWCLLHTIIVRKPGLLFRALYKLVGKTIDGSCSRITVVSRHEVDCEELASDEDENSDN